MGLALALFALMVVVILYSFIRVVITAALNPGAPRTRRSVWTSDSDSDHSLMSASHATTIFTSDPVSSGRSDTSSASVSASDSSSSSNSDSSSSSSSASDSSASTSSCSSGSDGGGATGNF